MPTYKYPVPGVTISERGGVKYEYLSIMVDAGSTTPVIHEGIVAFALGLSDSNWDQNTYERWGDIVLPLGVTCDVTDVLWDANGVLQLNVVLAQASIGGWVSTSAVPPTEHDASFGAAFDADFEYQPQICYPFDSSAEVSEWTETSDVDNTWNESYSSSGGNPGGYMNCHCANKANSGLNQLVNAGIFEDFGVPSGGVVDQIKAFTYDYWSDTNDTGSHGHNVRIETDSSVVLVEIAITPYTGNQAWTNAGSDEALGLSLASTAACNIVIENTGDTGNGPSNYIDHGYDNICFVIRYQPPAITHEASITLALGVSDEEKVTTDLSASIVRGPAVLSGSFSSPLPVGVTYLSGAITRGPAVVEAGVSRYINSSEDAVIPAANLFIAVLNGVETPMEQFSVNRLLAKEYATAYFPDAFDGVYSVGQTFVIKMYSSVGGVVTETTLYSGTIAKLEIEGTRLKVFSEQAQTWSSVVRRPLVDIAYVAEYGDTTRVRARIDNRIVPGDQVEIGTRIMTVRTVVFYSTGTNEFMEVFDG